MQGFSFERKIQIAQRRIMEWHYHWDGAVSLSFSGGKDSTCALDLARRCFPDIEAVYVDTGLDLPEVRKFALSQPNVTVLKPKMRFDEIIKTYGWCYPSKDVSRTLRYAQKGGQWALNRLKGLNPDGSPSKFMETHYKKWAFLLDSGIKISDICCEIMKEKPMKEYAKLTGKHPIIATLAVESRRRRENWMRGGCNSYHTKQPSSKPLSIFTEQDVLRYLRDFRIPYASVYGDIVEDKRGQLSTTGEKRTGCAFCPVGCHRDKVNRFKRLSVTHPKLYNYIINTLGLKELLDFIGVDYGGETECRSEERIPSQILFLRSL
jgi:3'-phosphoadenosine 5'-phosphosulfate sulfotransferase (PAPS reductase)/FAD synthetase